MKAKKRLVGFLVAAFAVGGAAPALAADEMVISASGETTPAKLRRSQGIPAALRVGFTSEEVGSAEIPDLSRIELEISRNVSFEPDGLPSCPLKIPYSRTTDARRVCAGSLVGHGRVASEISLPGQVPTRVEGDLLAFYSSVSGARRILAQVRTEGPVALTYVLAFRIEKARGPFGTSLSVRQKSALFECVGSTEDLPRCFHEPYTYNELYGHISRFEMSLHRRFSHRGARRSFVTARCPIPSNRRAATFPIVRVSLDYFTRATDPLTATATDRCEAVTG